MNTSMERVKSFSPSSGGAVDLPRNEMEVESTCRWICEKVTGIYLPRVINAMEVGVGLIRDVMENPSYYSYPFLTVVFAAKSNGVELSGLDVDYLLGSKVSGSKPFDEGVLKNIVDNCMRERSEIGRGSVAFLIFRARMGFVDFLSIEISSRMKIGGVIYS
ncbi:hypothetical protein GPU89_02355 [Burkholderia cepacia]|nr:hypothetical protein [Burkholderia cepacia]